MTVCPYCKSPLRGTGIPVMLSKKRKRILDYIASGGPEGVKQEALVAEFFADNSPVTVRTTLFFMNEKIKPRQIRCHGGYVRLEGAHWPR